MAEEDYWSGAIAALQPCCPEVPLTEKHMRRPPFKFLHDIFHALLQKCPATFPGVPAGSWDASTIDGKDAKVTFLEQILSDVEKGLSKKIDVLPKKIATGSECEKTNQFLIDVAAHFNLVSTCGPSSATSTRPATAAAAAAVAVAAGEEKSKADKRSKDKSEKQSKRDKTDKENDLPPPPPTAPFTGASSQPHDEIPPPPPPPAGKGRGGDKDDDDTSRPPTAATKAAPKKGDPAKAALAARADEFREKVGKYGMSLDSNDLTPLAMAEAAIVMKREIDESRRDATVPPKTGVQLSQEQLEAQILKQIEMIKQIDSLVKGNASLVDDLILHATQ